MASGPITSWQIDGGKVETVTEFNFMATVTVLSDFGAQENKVSLFPFFPHLFAMK